MDPVSGALIAQAGSAIIGGVAGKSSAEAERKDAEINSFIGRTRAIQTDTVARESLSDDLGSMRAVFGANGQTPGVGTFEVMRETREMRDRDRRIEFGNRMSESAGYSRQASAAKSKGNMALLSGVARAGPSIFDFADYRSKKNGDS